MGAVGPNHLVVMHNQGVRVLNRSGSTVYSTESLSNWWARGISGFHFVFDPKVVYDPYNDRYISAAVADAPPNQYSAAIFLAVTATGDPSPSNWYRWLTYVDSTTSTWADYPSLGFSSNKIVVSVNMFTTNTPSAISHVRVFFFNKPNIYSGIYETPVLLSGTNVGHTIAPVSTYDPNVSTVYFVQDYLDNSGGQSYLELWSGGGAFGFETITPIANIGITSPWASLATSSPTFLPQKGTAVKLDAGDSRIRNAVYRNGKIWSDQTNVSPASAHKQTDVQWFQLITTGAVVQRGRVTDATNFYA